MRTCSVCKKTKHETAYSQSKHTADGLRILCETCRTGVRVEQERDARCGKCGKRLNPYNTSEYKGQVRCNPCETGLVGEIPAWLGDLADGVDKQQSNTLAQMWMDSRSIGWLK